MLTKRQFFLKNESVHQEKPSTAFMQLTVNTFKTAALTVHVSAVPSELNAVKLFRAIKIYPLKTLMSSGQVRNYCCSVFFEAA